MTLRDVAPETARILEEPADIPLDRVHETLHAAFGRKYAHLFLLCIEAPCQMGATHGVVPAFVDARKDLPADKTTLADALDRAAVKGPTYLYDVGDEWEHAIVATLPSAAKPGRTYPRLVNAEGNCPPENVGDPPGCAEFAATMTDPKYPDRHDVMAWYAGVFDPSQPNQRAFKTSMTKPARRWLSAWWSRRFEDRDAHRIS